MIKLTNHGVANVIKGDIYINKRLKKYPSLYTRVIAHERKHLNNEDHVDLKEPFDWELFKFIITNPSTWTQFLPIWIKGRKIIYNQIMLGFFLVLCYIIVFIFLGFIDPYISLFAAGGLPFFAWGVAKWLF